MFFVLLLLLSTLAFANVSLLLQSDHKHDNETWNTDSFFKMDKQHIVVHDRLFMIK